jgi:signal transduction histidine kinase
VLFVRGDEQRLEQVMSNLLSNAIKYGTPGTQVVFELRERDGYAEVTVSNRGPGIPADELPRLFDRYMRSRTVSAEGPKGLGVGLYIAKGLVEAHGGRIWIESVPGDTTTFHFTIPLDGPPVARILPPPAAEPSRPQHVPSRP